MFRRIKHTGTQGSILIEATIAASLLILLAYGSMHMMISAIRQNKWAAVQTLADAALDFEAARAKRIAFDKVQETYQPQNGETYRETTKSLGMLSSQDVQGTFRYVCKTQTMQPNNRMQYCISIGLKYTLYGVDYIKTREVVRYEGF